MGCLAGCLLFVDGFIAVCFFALFNFLGMPAIGIMGGCFLGFPALFCGARKCITLAKEAHERKQEALQQAEMKRQREAQRQAEMERRNSECHFGNGITEDEFSTMAHHIAKRIRRLHISVNGPRIMGNVESQSGISTWNFEVDFNDYGRVTGAWWMIFNDNFDSGIPNRFSDLLQQEIKKKLSF